MIFWEYGDIQGDHKWLTDLVELSNTSSSTGSKRSSYERNTTSFTTSLFKSHDNKNLNKIYFELKNSTYDYEVYFT